MLWLKAVALLGVALVAVGVLVILVGMYAGREVEIARVGRNSPAADQSAWVELGDGLAYRDVGFYRCFRAITGPQMALSCVK